MKELEDEKMFTKKYYDTIKFIKTDNEKVDFVVKVINDDDKI